MKKFFSLILLLSLAFSASAQTEATCAFDDFAEAYSSGIDYYWFGDYANAINEFTCTIGLIPADVEANGGLSMYDDYAGVYLNRGWAYLQNGDFSLIHPDFYRWIELTETQTIEQSLDETFAAGNFQIEEGLVYRLSFEGETGQIIGFSAMTEDAIDPLIALLAPDGSLLISDDDGGINLDAVIRRYTLPETGTYTLVVSQAGGFGTGEVELAIYQNGEVRSTNPDNSEAILSFAAYYLYVGETAEVFTTEGDSLNLRSGAGLEYEIIDRLQSGERVTLLEGPHKEDGGYAWWRVRTSEGLEGWAVERVETEQTLQLALFTGEEALVTSAPDLLNVRDGAARDQNVIFQLEDGAVVTILDDEPIIADGGLRWWHIRDEQGREGWAVDRIGVERTLAPVREFPNG